jgi:sugar/nucleoside kinase (ribokinase family)
VTGVLVVGDLVTDVVVRPAGAVADGSDTAATVLITGGGGAANTATWLAAAGMPVTLVARVGDDAAGRERCAELTALGVRSAVVVDKSMPTGAIVVLVASDGERTMLADRGANLRLSPADVDAGFAAAEPTHLHLSGYSLLAAATRPAGLDALALARAAGLTVSVDAASVAPLAAAGPAAFRRWIDGIDLLLANAAEATVLTGVDDPADAAEKLLATASAVVVKRGAAGAVWCSPGVRITVPAAATELVDSTGAGDAFAAGLLAAWLGGADPQAALHAGAALGARAAGHLGARPMH